MLKTHVKRTTEKTANEISKKDLEVAAYYRWMNRGAPLGEDLDDWYEVENKWRDNIVPQNND